MKLKDPKPNPGANVVFGSSLKALRFAVDKDLKIILENPVFPPIYERSEIKKEWASLFLKLMLEGKTIGGDSVSITRIDDDFIYVVSKGNITNKIVYNNIYFFSDKKILGLDAPLKQNKQYKVIDHLQQVSLSIPHLNYIKTPDPLVNEVFISKPDLRRKTQIYVISYLNEKQLYDFDYSDTIVRFKCEDILRQEGFTGTANGKNKRLLRLESVFREVTEPMHEYKDTDKVKFFNGN